jgi:hypothetical protein
MRRRASLRLGRQTLPPGQAAPSNMSRLSTASDKDYFENQLLTAERLSVAKGLIVNPLCDCLIAQKLIARADMEMSLSLS